MRSRVYLSTSSSILTILVIGLLILGCIATYGGDRFIILLAAILMLSIFGMIYAPLSISANDKEVYVDPGALWAIGVFSARVTLVGIWHIMAKDQTVSSFTLTMETSMSSAVKTLAAWLHISIVK